MRLVIVAVALVLAASAAEAAPAAPASFVMAPAYNWTGAYAGVSAGYSWGQSNSSYDNPGLKALVAIDPMNAAGWFGGIQGGANYQASSNLVLGIEADLQYGSVSDKIVDLAAGFFAHPGGYANTIKSETDFSGTLRGRLGLAFDRTLVFGTGGLAWAHTTIRATDGGLSDSATLVGWTAGIGVEQAVSDTISMKLEYLYTDFGSHVWFPGQAFSSTGTATSNSLRAGVNFHL